MVADLFLQTEREWDRDKVLNVFSPSDAAIILAINIPAISVVDHLAWDRTTNGHYSVKTGYQLWHDRNIGVGSVTQSNGWSKIWKADLPHKVKLFLWRFCRNNVPVKHRLNSKGVCIPLECPMCNSGIEDMVHVFFTCPFAVACWQYIGWSVDISTEDYAPGWLLQKLQTASSSEILLIAKVFWGIWFFRNKKVWDNKNVTAVIAMEWSAKSILDWKEAKEKRVKRTTTLPIRVPEPVKWDKPGVGTLKLNVDAAIKLGDTSFAMGLVLRDHTGALVSGKTVCKAMVATVVEAEAQAVLEGFHWLLEMDHDRVVLESDSLSVVRALQSSETNLLEVGLIIDACRFILDAKVNFSVSFVKRQANRVAHLVAKLPCSMNCQNIITAPSGLLLESLLYDAS